LGGIIFGVLCFHFIFTEHGLMEMIVVYFYLHSMVVEKIISTTAPLLSCWEYVQQITTLDYLPEGLRYQGKQVFVFYCKGLDGGWIQ
jgi:hypothetical protein